MAPPTWSVGQVLTASDVNNWFVPLAAYKVTNTDRSTTGITLDPDLQLTVAANAFYEVSCFLRFFETVGSGGGLNFGFSAPSGSAGSWGMVYNLSGTPTWNSFAWTGTAGPVTTPGGGQGLPISGALFTGSTSGTLGLQWAANTSGDTIRLDAGCVLTANRIG